MIHLPMEMTPEETICRLESLLGHRTLGQRFWGLLRALRGRFRRI